MAYEEIMNDLELTREVLLKKDISTVIVNNSKIIFEEKGDEIKIIIKTIEKYGEELQDTVIGLRTHGKASAFLCSYAKVKAVFTLQATKTAIAVMIMTGIPCQTDEIIPYVKENDSVCSYDEILKNIDNSEKAYKLLKSIIEKENCS